MCLQHIGIRTDRILFNIFVIFFILILLPPFTILSIYDIFLKNVINYVIATRFYCLNAILLLVGENDFFADDGATDIFFSTLLKSKLYF